MKSVLYLIRRRPGIAADETTDLMLVSGVFEQRTSVLFLDDGVYQLLGLGERQSSLKALSAYDVQDLYVAADSLASRQVSADAIELDLRIVDRHAVRQLIADHDLVLTD